ncbi:TPA: hypothetical protein ACRXUN_001766, partial [Pseudomonas aeruginosa]
AQKIGTIRTSFLCFSCPCSRTALCAFRQERSPRRIRPPRPGAGKTGANLVGKTGAMTTIKGAIR